MNAIELKERITRQREDITALVELWKELIPSFLPSNDQFKLWHVRHGFEVSAYAIQETGAKLLSLGTMTPEHLVRFTSSVMNATTRKASGVQQ